MALLASVLPALCLWEGMVSLTSLSPALCPRERMASLASRSPALSRVTGVYVTGCSFLSVLVDLSVFDSMARALSILTTSASSYLFELLALPVCRGLVVGVRLLDGIQLWSHLPVFSL